MMSFPVSVVEKNYKIYPKLSNFNRWCITPSVIAKLDGLYNNKCHVTFLPYVVNMWKTLKVLERNSQNFRNQI